MASSDSSAEMPAPSQTPNPTPGLLQGASNPGLTISLLEIGSLPPFCWGSLPSPKNSCRPVARTGTVQKFSNLLRDVKEVLKSIAGFEEKTTEARESTNDANAFEDMSKFKEKIRGAERRNKVRLKNMLINLDPEREQNAKKQEMILKHKNSKNAVQVYARDLGNSEEIRDFNEIQLSMEKGRYGSHHLHGEYRKLRNNMDQLLQEADHWSKQHTELSKLMKLYQKSQKERRETLENNAAYFQIQPNNDVSPKQDLEAQVKKLSHDTHSLRIIAALLENECHILQQRVEILNEFHLHEARTLQEKPSQVHYEQDKKNQKSAEADRVESNRQTTRELEGTVHKKEKIYRNSDACLSKKARNNRFNSRIARRTLIAKRRTVSSFR